MFSLSYLLSFAHLLGMALGVGAATVKTVLLLKATADPALLPVYAKVARPVTKTIILGLMLLALSGITWLVQGYSFTPLMVTKSVLVGLILVVGPLIDNVVEPRLTRLMPAPGQQRSPEFIRVQRQYVTVELLATGLMYAAMIIGTQL